MEQDKVGRVPDGNGLSQAETEDSLGPTGFDPSRYGGPYCIPWKPNPSCWIALNIIPRPKTYGLWWGMHDHEGWFDGGCISNHRTRRAAQAKARLVAYWLEARDSDGSPKGRDAQRLDGEAATARAEGIAPSDSIAQSNPGDAS